MRLTDFYATEPRMRFVRELSVDRFSFGLLLQCSPQALGQSLGKGQRRVAVLNSQCGKPAHLLSPQIATNSSSL